VKSAAFLDRDGTIIEDVDYCKAAREVRFISGAVEALKLLLEKGYDVFVISNQSGVGRKIISELQFEKVDTRFREMLKENGINVSGIAYCKHLPEEKCICRKPNPFLALKLAPQTIYDYSKSFVVGDKLSDIEFGLNLNVGKKFLVLTGKGKRVIEQLGMTKVFFDTCSNLLEVANKIPSNL